MLSEPKYVSSHERLHALYKELPPKVKDKLSKQVVGENYSNLPKEDKRMVEESFVSEYSLYPKYKLDNLRDIIFGFNKALGVE